MKLLLVEDEPLILEEMDSYLTGQGYRCERAADLSAALKRTHLFTYDLIVLGIAIPGSSGSQLLKALKSRNNNAGVLIVSAKDSLRDKLSGLELGADDYVTKPFHMEELNARIFALLRRRTFSGENEIRVGNLTIDVAAQRLCVDSEPVSLTRKEFELLLYFVVNKNRVVSRQSIMEHLWGDHYDMAENYDIVYVHTMNLRKKFAAYADKNYIKTVHGIGYKWVSPDFLP